MPSLLSCIQNATNICIETNGYRVIVIFNIFQPHCPTPVTSVTAAMADEDVGKEQLMVDIENNITLQPEG